MKPFEAMPSLEALREKVRTETAVLVYFSTPECNVCKVLKPKIAALLEEHFPSMAAVYVDCTALPEAAGQYRVFSVPTVLAFYAGQEGLRKGRSLGIVELARELQRPYALLFDKD